MKMELTQRDKGLIVFLGVIVTIFIFGYFFIYPISQTIKETDSEIETQEDLKEVNDYKLMNLLFVQDDNKKLEEKMAVVRKNFYPIMESDQVDKYFTEMALDYNLYVYFLKIRQAEDEVESKAYQYSVKYEEDKLHADEAKKEKKNLKKKMILMKKKLRMIRNLIPNLCLVIMTIALLPEYMSAVLT